MSTDPFSKDLKISHRDFNWRTSDREIVDLELKGSGDLDTISGRANLAQAIINRLLTRKGELTALGHPEYGSRLHTLIGELNNIKIHAKAEIYIRECLAQEKRIAKIVRIQITPPSNPGQYGDLMAEIIVQPADGKDGQNMTIVLPINTGT